MRLTKMREEGRDVINLGWETRMLPLPSICWRRSGMPFSTRTTIITQLLLQRPLKEAIAGWYGEGWGPARFQHRSSSSLGVERGLFLIHLCLLDCGDTALVPDPAYPSYEAGSSLPAGKWNSCLS